ncbi:hypothetical protein [Pseudoroseicyclus aestuarii]|uniref:Flagellar protein FliT n=1 Tax=Pseudoroseicyclus aestuarii TaxID=1795041 RepID=A0A318SRE0_9RHOB|nr:hypothetical protein [Pseudoroseicyclus aestuarii]PYE84380.1 hypothetical protein DFP88_102178 [Pseudoroseicyclus aestuarii]
MTAPVAALTVLLTEEIAAIRRGDLPVIDRLAPEKARLAALIEAQDPSKTPEGLPELRALIAEDARLLDMLTEATAGLAAELRRVRDRHSLKGLYGRSGDPAPAQPGASGRFDRTW